MVEMRRQSTANTSSGSSNSMDVLHEGTKQPRMPRRRIIACLDGTWNTPSGICMQVYSLSTTLTTHLTSSHKCISLLQQHRAILPCTKR